MSLSHLNTEHIIKYTTNPIFNSLFEIDFIFKTKNNNSYLEHNYFKYELSKDKLTLSLHFNDDLILDELIDSINNLNQIVIKIHNKSGIVKYLFNLTEIKFIDFKFNQDLNKCDDLTIIDIFLDIH